MNKKKILTLALTLCVAAILAIGGTLAYFTDTDKATNVFTSGKVDITLKEDYTQNSKLLPATGSAQQGTLQNGVKKEIKVTNNSGSEDAYVRVHIAIPSILDDGADTFDAGKNVLHFNYEDDSIGAGKWDWSKTADDGKYEGNWNYYETKIDNIEYNVYVVTYGTALKANETTEENALHQVYLDAKVTSADMEKLNTALGNEWKIYVVAEGAQAAGFANAYEALNAAFGVPSATNNPWAATATE